MKIEELEAQGYGLVCGASPVNGCYTRDGRFYRVVADDLIEVDDKGVPLKGAPQVALSAVKNDDDSEPQGTQDDEAARMKALLDEYDAKELFDMAVSLKEKLDEAGVQHDVEPVKGDEDVARRCNAEQIAKYT